MMLTKLEITFFIFFFLFSKTEGIKECKKATFGPGEITFQDLGVLGEYTLQIRDEIFETIKLSKIGKSV